MPKLTFPPRKEYIRVTDVPGGGSCGAHSQLLYIAYYLKYRSKLSKLCADALTLIEMLSDVHNVENFASSSPEIQKACEIDEVIARSYQGYYQTFIKLQDISSKEQLLRQIRRTKSVLDSDPFESNPLLKSMLGSPIYKNQRHRLISSFLEVIDLSRNNYQDYDVSATYFELFNAFLTKMVQYTSRESLIKDFGILPQVIETIDMISLPPRLAALRLAFIQNNKDCPCPADYNIHPNYWLTENDHSRFLWVLRSPMDIFGVEFNIMGSSATEDKAFFHGTHWNILHPKSLTLAGCSRFLELEKEREKVDKNELLFSILSIMSAIEGQVEKIFDNKDYADFYDYLSRDKHRGEAIKLLDNTIEIKNYIGLLSEFADHKDIVQKVVNCFRRAFAKFSGGKKGIFDESKELPFPLIDIEGIFSNFIGDIADLIMPKVVKKELLFSKGAEVDEDYCMVEKPKK